MIHGLDVFRRYFSGMEENYILIGGAACGWKALAATFEEAHRFI